MHAKVVKCSFLSPRYPSPLINHLHIFIRHSISIRPILNLVEIAAHMVAFVIRPIPYPSGLLVEGEDIDVGETHEVHAQDLDAVVYPISTTYHLKGMEDGGRKERVQEGSNIPRCARTRSGLSFVSLHSTLV